MFLFNFNFAFKFKHMRAVCKRSSNYTHLLMLENTCIQVKNSILSRRKATFPYVFERNSKITLFSAMNIFVRTLLPFMATKIDMFLIEIRNLRLRSPTDLC